jgi:hypothetical protein
MGSNRTVSLLFLFLLPIATCWAPNCQCSLSFMGPCGVRHNVTVVSIVEGVGRHSLLPSLTEGVVGLHTLGSVCQGCLNEPPSIGSIVGSHPVAALSRRRYY